MFAAATDPLIVGASNVVLVVSIIGTVAFALSGVMAATEAGMDWLGGVVLAVVAAIGGGTMRDLLIDGDVFWVSDEWPYVRLLCAGRGVCRGLLAGRFSGFPGEWSEDFCNLVVRFQWVP